MLKKYKYSYKTYHTNFKELDKLLSGETPFPDCVYKNGFFYGDVTVTPRMYILHYEISYGNEWSEGPMLLKNLGITYDRIYCEGQTIGLALHVYKNKIHDLANLLMLKGIK